MAHAGIRWGPEHSVFDRVFQRLPETTLIYVNFANGTALAGNPRNWTFDPESSVRELYLRYPQWWNRSDGGWDPTNETGGVLVNMEDVHSIEILDDPVSDG